MPKPPSSTKVARDSELTAASTRKTAAKRNLDAVERKESKKKALRLDNTVASECSKKKVQLSDLSNSALNFTENLQCAQGPVGSAEMNTEYSHKKFKKAFKSRWKAKLENIPNDSSNVIGCTSAEVIKDPFTCAVIPDFLKHKGFLCSIWDHIAKMKLHDKKNDLYCFKQSEDVSQMSNEEQPHLKELHKFFSSEVREWLTSITGIQLNEKMTMGVSLYQFGDHLLCHDDELEGRRIAFILYLVNPWKPEHGGALNLFDRDENEQPKSVVKSLFPEFNRLSFFEVTPHSFHEVQEVFAREQNRLSINGWFYGKSLPRPKKHVEVPKPLQSAEFVEQSVLYSWINPSYLDMETQLKIRRKFGRDSQIQLSSFLVDEKYKELYDVLKKDDSWQQIGPANKRRYQRLGSFGSEVLREYLQVMQSEAMFVILSHLTGLHLHPLGPDDSDDEEEEDCDDSLGNSEIDDGLAGSSESSLSDENENKTRKNTIKAGNGAKDSATTLAEDTKVSGGVCKAACRYEVRRWTPGSYTLLHDDEASIAQHEYALDTSLFFCSKRSFKNRSRPVISYLARDEDMELLTVIPESNCLALVYRDPDTLRFNKYIHSGSKLKENVNLNEALYHDVSFVYYEDGSNEKNKKC